MFEETNSSTEIKIEPIEYPQVKQELEDYENTTGICMENDEICPQQFLISEVTVEEDIKQEIIDEQDFKHDPQVKQEVNHYDYTSDMSIENDEICLQEFLKSEVTIDEEMKQEKIDGQYAAPNTSLNEKTYIFNENIGDSSNMNKSFESVSETCKINDNLKPHKCKFCHKTFKRKYHLKHHEIIHTGERPHKCEICHKAFKERCHLKRHKMIHTGEFPYSCEICPKAFRQKRHLKDHKTIHTGEIPHTCNICNKTFTSKQYRETHENSHTGVNPCEICNKSFATKLSLSRHKMYHTEERPYSCEICNKAFAIKDVLRQHLIRVHDVRNV
ncbi:zinc finger protein 570-like [Ctenocephalides felis]|uniref:zinc finger protein 570-like n=1 Tax=Ctenocephalides felis TaxID=7515 RepID=UPI000E6E1AFD|nr:zinc finger protein 570-like [Ctenocephalides felis]